MQQLRSRRQITVLPAVQPLLPARVARVPSTAGVIRESPQGGDSPLVQLRRSTTYFQAFGQPPGRILHLRQPPGLTASVSEPLGVSRCC
ncbi:hypothetical protein NDU88_002652 [Pleurodeles waltl]|uniref:Uncharacterized protein n=1 Tax=Pleurodeles waltl TaxID=8319 RepID=A0AAV7QDJ3_PLEWA|nr:hypothetical protein NDU88_002652 [Pleurodeles waltl]